MCVCVSAGARARTHMFVCVCVSVCIQLHACEHDRVSVDVLACFNTNSPSGKVLPTKSLSRCVELTNRAGALSKPTEQVR